MASKPRIRDDVRGLATVLWVAVVGALFFPIGILLLTIAYATFCLPPAYVIIRLISGDYLIALVALIAWIFWLRISKPFYGFVFEGWQHGGL